MAEDPTDAAAVLNLAREFLKQQAEFGLGDVPKGVLAETEEDLVSEDAAQALAVLGNELCDCRSCGLAEHRTRVVVGAGSAQADLMFLGEAPGAEEDRQGVPFVGAAGQLLTRMIEAMGLSRGDVYIANVIKCRPPGNRDPQPDEIAQCEPFLMRQVEVIKPTVICTLGRFAAQTLLKTSDSMGRLRGRVFDYCGAKLVPTYHPAALLRNSQWKRPTWEDLKLVRRIYDGTDL